jgi:hypothetical protein
VTIFSKKVLPWFGLVPDAFGIEFAIRSRALFFRPTIEHGTMECGA